MSDAVNGKSTMSEEVIDQVGNDVKDALRKQFGGGNQRGEFRLRMSNLGRPTCQLWFEKNKPELASPKPNNFMINMMLGDIVEAVFKGLLRGAGVKYEEPEHVSLDVDGTTISGTYDLVVDGAVDDVKSASGWSYDNKFVKFERCFEDSAETWRGKPTGNRRLGITCGFCDYKHACWENLKELPSVMSKAKIPPTVYYTELTEEYA